TEILKLFSGILLNVEELNKRKEAFLFAIDHKKITVLSGDKAKSKLAEYVPTINNSDVREFKGNIAMKGLVRSRALVYKWGDDMSSRLASVKEGFILVAGQTRPQLMPLILKCSGIITDEGGITSHAAIVSRELKIPCVIGTKIATQVIKDGDMVEIDANKGVIKIIK
ncbi:MAG: PEP-utilizing enzyme, partial [bacterium]